MGEPEKMHARIDERTAEGYVPLVLETERGEIGLRWYEATGSPSAVAYVGGAGGGWDTPAHGLYPRLCEELTAEGLHGLRVRFRDARDLGGCVFDLVAATAYLRHMGVHRLALVGHSLGGAAVIQTASVSPEARTVVTLATQSHGADARDLPRDCSLLLVHGEADTVLPPSASECVYAQALGPRRLVLLPGAGHVLDEAADEVHDEVRTWLLREMTGQ